jgi:hypothetical protein
LSIERHATCWKSACKHELSPIPCKPRYLDCGTLNFADRKSWENTTVVFSRCNPSNKTFFDYGIFANALNQNVLSSEFLEKYFYCLWWGLQNLRYKCSFKIMIASDCILSFSLNRSMILKRKFSFFGMQLLQINICRYIDSICCFRN